MKVSFISWDDSDQGPFLFGEQGLSGLRKPNAVVEGTMSKSTERETGVGDQYWERSGHGVDLGHSLPSQPGEYRQYSFNSSEIKKEADISLTREEGKHHYENLPSLPKEQLCPCGEADPTLTLQAFALTLNVSVLSHQFGRFHQLKDSRSFRSCPRAP